MATTTESLIVELDAKIDKYLLKMKEGEEGTNGMGGAADRAAKAVKGIVIASTAAAAAVSALVVSSAQFAREVQVAANRAGETVERMQSLAFATNTVGISLEKLGDIAKDTNEKIGEFLVTGGGGFVDFVDVMKLSGAEARAAALEFQNMSGPDVLQEMVKRMEAAGVSGQQMSFALEGVASDATDLIPLLRDGAKGLNELTGQFEELGLVLTQEQLDRIKEVGREFSNLTATFSAEGRALIAEYSDEIIIAIQSAVLLGTKTIDALNLIATGWGNLIEISQAAISDLINGTDTLAETIEARANQTKEAIESLLGTGDKPLEVLIKKTKKANKELSKDDKTTQDQKLKNLRNFTKGASALNQAFFDDNKAINAGLIIADTAAAAISEYKKGGPVAAFAAIAFGLAQLAANASASKGGGDVSGGAVPQVQPQQQDFAPETTGLELSEATAAGGDVLRIEFATDSGVAIFDAIAEGLNEGQKRGQF
jgi:hypothetical protein